MHILEELFESDSITSMSPREREFVSIRSTEYPNRTLNQRLLREVSMRLYNAVLPGEGLSDPIVVFIGQTVRSESLV